MRLLSIVAVVPPLVYEKFINFCGYSRNASQGIDIVLILDLSVSYFIYIFCHINYCHPSTCF